MLQDLRYALRQLLKQPGFTAASVLTLGLGIGANATIFGVVDTLLFRPPSHVSNPDRVVRIYFTLTWPPFGTQTISHTSFPNYQDIRDGTRSFETVAAFSDERMAVGRGENAVQVQGSLVTHTFFQLLGVHPVRGRFFGADEDRVSGGSSVAVISEGFWRRQFAADANVLGRTLDIGTRVYTIVGIAPNGFTGVDLEAVDVWLPMEVAADDFMGPEQLTSVGRGSVWLQIVGRVRRGINSSQAEEDASFAFRRGNAEYLQGNRTARVTLWPVQAARGPDTSENARVSTWLAGVAAIVLLIACANVAHLMLTRSSRRKREIAVRLALGAGRGRLVRQLLLESLLLSMLGGGAALLFVLWGGPVIRAFLLPDTVSFGIIDPRLLAFMAVAVVATAVFSGVAPALHASRPDITTGLKSGARKGSVQRSLLRTGLLIGQVALTLVLLVGAGLFISSLRSIRAVDMGLEQKRVVVGTMDLQAVGYAPDDITQAYLRILERVQALPGVESAAVSIGSPFGWSHAMSVKVPGLHSLPRLNTGGPYGTAATPGYFATLGMRVLRGRPLDAGDHSDATRVVVVNETLARLTWPSTGPVGQCVQLGSDTTCRTVVGVVADARRNELIEEPTMQVFLPLDQYDFGESVNALLVRTHDRPEAMVPALRRAMQSVAANLPYARVRPLQELIDPQTRPWSLGATMFGSFGALALILAAIGMYGVLAYAVTQRTHELGIRIALGAEAADVLRLVVGEGVRVAIIGVCLGIVGALLSGRVLRSLLFGVGPSDPLVLAAASALLLSVAATASYVPARRATRVDPMEALRHE